MESAGLMLGWFDVVRGMARTAVQAWVQAAGAGATGTPGRPRQPQAAGA
jgi:hypothetical protein